MASAIELLRRGAQVLMDLELLSEAQAARAPDDQLVTSGSSSTGTPAGFNLEKGTREQSLLDKHLASLEEWIVRAEFDRDRHRFRAPSREPETAAQFAARLVSQYAGVHDLDVAKREGVSRAYVRKIRKQANRDQLRGEPTEP